MDRVTLLGAGLVLLGLSETIGMTVLFGLDGPLYARLGQFGGLVLAGMGVAMALGHIGTPGWIAD